MWLPGFSSQDSQRIPPLGIRLDSLDRFRGHQWGVASSSIYSVCCINECEARKKKPTTKGWWKPGDSPVKPVKPEINFTWVLLVGTSENLAWHKKWRWWQVMMESEGRTTTTISSFLKESPTWIGISDTFPVLPSRRCWDIWNEKWLHLRCGWGWGCFRDEPIIGTQAVQSRKDWCLELRFEAIDSCHSERPPHKSWSSWWRSCQALHKKQSSRGGLEGFEGKGVLMENRLRTTTTTTTTTGSSITTPLAVRKTWFSAAVP